MLRLPSILLALAVAGCFGGTPAPSQAPTPGQDVPGTEGLEATKSTGVLRGFAVDDAVRPLANVSIEVQHPDGTTSLTATGPAGSFGMDGLDPGTYVVRGRLAGYLEAQAIAAVRADVDDPVPVRLDLQRDLEAIPYFIAASFDGFIPCGVRGGTGGVHCGALSQVREAISDRSQFLLEVDPEPTFAQAEMLWDSTQPLADQLGLYLRRVPFEGNDQFMGIYPLNQGPSPVRITVNATGVGICATCVEDPFVMAGWQALEISVRSGELSSTSPPPTCSPTGSPCLTGVGATVNQQVRVFVHVLYRAEPAEGWSFSEHGDPFG